MLVSGRLVRSYSNLPDVAGFPARWHREILLDALACDPNARHLDDAVTLSIRAQGVWEAHETLAAIDVLSNNAGTMLDFGAHIGWFSVLAGLFGDGVVWAWETDQDTLMALNANALRYDLDMVLKGAVTETMAPVQVEGPVSLVKVDLEGMDCWAIDACAHLFEAGRVAAALVEVSPIFEHDGRGPCRYVELVERFMGWGYRPYRMPPKGWDWLDEYREAPVATLRARRGLGSDWAWEIDSCVQDNFLFLPDSPGLHR